MDKDKVTAKKIKFPKLYCNSKTLCVFKVGSECKAPFMCKELVSTPIEEITKNC